MSVAVVTDPSAVMPASWRSELGIVVVEIDVVWPDGSSDPGDAPYAAIEERLAREPVPPTTGAPSPGTYTQLISGLLETHDGVLVVCPASDLSGTFQSAMLGARETGDDRVRVLDSRTAASGQGIVAAEAARLATTGATVDVVAARAADVASRVHIWATLSQLDFLRRSGRVPAVAAFGAGALGIQPVVRYTGGSPSPVGVVRSTERGTERLLRAWERTVTHAPLRAVAFHSARASDAQRIVDGITARTPDADAHAVEMTASMASHTGDGLLGLAWHWDLKD